MYVTFANDSPRAFRFSRNAETALQLEQVLHIPASFWSAALSGQRDRTRARDLTPAAAVRSTTCITRGLSAYAYWQLI